jgi:hypothetical protein
MARKRDQIQCQDGNQVEKPSALANETVSHEKNARLEYSPNETAKEFDKV